ncbi:MAG TPA: hypothetical protein VD930_12775 [Gemmatimonadales bacterium]|nr:hypothetical protein [Gemmatimonadales bacterium]
MFESLKAQLDRLLRAHPAADPRARAALLREALLEAKVGVSTMRSALAATERELEAERRQLADAERRGRLAGEIPDPETVAVAERFVARHRERVGVLERKLVVQRDELMLAEREAAEMLSEYRAARPGASFESIDAAWRDLQAAGAERPELGLDADPGSSNSDEKLKQAVDAQLAYLKKKLGKEK